MVRFCVDIKQLVVRFPKGKNFVFAKLKVTLSKFISRRLVSMVIDSPSFLNKAMIFFLILSSTGPLLLLIAASLSSLYNSTFSLAIKLNNLSNNVLPPFLTQVPSLLKSSDYLASFIRLMALSTIFVKDLGYGMDFLKKISEIIG